MTEEQHLDGAFLIDEYRRSRQIGRRLILLGVLILLAFAVFQAMRKEAPPPLDYSKLGIHLLLDDGRNLWPESIWDAHIAAAAPITSPGGIAVQVIRADDLDPIRWQHFMDLAAEHDLTPVLRLATTFDRANGWWDAPDVDEAGGYTQWGERYADFINALDWGMAQKHVILLNEPNNGHEWGGRPDPSAYAQFVVDVSDILREQVDGIAILNAAFDLYAPHTGSEPFPDTAIYLMDANSYLDVMEAAQPGIFASFDLWNSHAYPINLTASPAEQAYGFDFIHDAVDTTTTPPEGVFNRGINGYEWELWKLAQFGIEAPPVMITEVGWRHAESTMDEALDTGESYPDERAVARYLDLALRGAASTFATGTVNWQALLADTRVIAIAPFALNGVPQEWGHTNWLQLNTDGQIIGYYAPYQHISNYPLRPDAQ